jgi:NADH-quinone oxidoreductase subunit L
VAWFDRHVVDGTMNGIGWVTATSAKKIKGLQSGNLPQYGLVFVLGAVVLVLIFSFLIG